MLLTKVACEHNTDIAVCAVEYNKNGHVKPLHDGKDMLVQGKDIAYLFYSMQSSYVMYNVFKLYRKGFLEEHNLQFDTSLSHGEDLIFNLAAYEKAKSLFYLNKQLYVYRPEKGGLNMAYRQNFAKIKVMLQQKLKDYLKKNNYLDDRYYAVAFNELFAIFKNDKSLSVLTSDFAADILSRPKIAESMPFVKKIAFKCFRCIYLLLSRRNRL